MKIDYPHVHTVKAKGRLYYYYRHRGKRIKLIGTPGTKEFALSYDAASETGKQALSGLRSVIADYYASVEFTSKAPRTQSDYLRHKAHIEEQWGNTPVGAFDDKRIRRDLRTWHKSLIKNIGARQADLVLATMRVILSFAVEDSVLSHNHLKGFSGAYKADRSDKIWTREDVAAFMKVAKRHFRLAMILALNLGRRRGDLLALTWGDYDGTHISVTNRKGGTKRKFKAKCTDALKATLDARKAALEKLGPVHRNDPILTTVTGLKWREDNFSSDFGEETKRAGINGLTFHDLRGTAITTLAENGCTPAEIASISGHSARNIDKILDAYQANTRDLNDKATAKMDKSWIAEVGDIE